MQSLFIKIFTAFWLAMILTSAIGIVLTLTIGPWIESHELRQRQYRLASQALINAYEEGGVAAYRQQIRKLEGKGPNRSFLLLRSSGIVDSASLPPEIESLAHLAEQSQVTQVHSGEIFSWVAYPATTDYVYILKRKRTSQFERLLGLPDLGVRMGITFLAAGIICFILTRSLTAPIEKLRKATRELASGSLTTRVGDSLSGPSEFASLGRDFDQMAERIESLVDTQHRLMRDISHELRSPLTRLNIAVELVRQADVAERNKLLDRIDRESERLNVLIGHMLTLSKLESSFSIAAREPTELQDLISDIVRDAEFEANKSGRKISLMAADQVVIEAAEELLRQAIENVVRNAIRCTAENSIVEVRLEAEEDSENPQVLISVRDHGPGVREEFLDHLFLPFYRVDEARDRKSGGSGLGLAITERAITLHGGSVTATNAAGGGLEVIISLPMEPTV
jgi:two-component system, OmpR family, sensor histidine kinase CpxA